MGMRIRLTEGMWKHHVSADLCNEMRSAIDEGDVDGIKAKAKEVLGKCREFFNGEEDEYELFELDDLVDEFDCLDSDNDEEDIDFALSELYDFCDDHRIFLDL